MCVLYEALVECRIMRLEGFVSQNCKYTSEEPNKSNVFSLQEQVGSIKERYEHRLMLKHLPAEFSVFLEHIIGLDYFTKPDYQLLVSVFDNSMKTYGIAESDPFDWEKSGMDNSLTTTTTSTTPQLHTRLTHAAIGIANATPIPGDLMRENTDEVFPDEQLSDGENGLPVIVSPEKIPGSPNHQHTQEKDVWEEMDANRNKLRMGICKAATEEEHSNGHVNGVQNLPSLGSPIRVRSETTQLDRDVPLLRKLRTIHSFELEKRMTLESKPDADKFLENCVQRIQKEANVKPTPAIDGSSTLQRNLIAAATPGSRDHVWHYDEYIPPCSKPGSASSPEHLDGVVSGGFIAVNLSSYQQDIDSKEWVIVDKERDLKDFGASGSKDQKATGSPSEEEPEVLQVLDDSPKDCQTNVVTWTTNNAYNKPGPGVGLHMVVSPGTYTDKLDPMSGAAGQLLAATPTSPMEAQADGALTPPGASHIPLFTTSRLQSNAKRFTTPIASHSRRPESPNRKETGIPKSQSADSCSTSSCSAGRRKLPVTPNSGTKYPSVIRLSKSQLTIPRPSVTSTQSASESFPCGPHLEKRERDSHVLEMFSPQENRAVCSILENASVPCMNKAELALQITSQDKSCVNPGDSGRIKFNGECDQMLLDRNGASTPVKSHSASQTDVKESKKEPNIGIDKQGCSPEHYKPPQDVVPSVYQPYESRTFHSVPNEDSDLEMLKPESANLSDKQEADLMELHKNTPEEGQQNGFHEVKDAAAANGFLGHEVNLSMFEKEKNSDKDLTNGELLDLSDDFHKCKKDLAKPSFAVRQSRIPVLAQEVETASESSSPISAKEKLLLKKAHQTDLARMLVEKQQIKSFLFDLSSASERSLEEKTSQVVPSSVENIPFSKTGQDLPIQRSFEEGTMTAHSPQMRKSKIPRPVSWSSSDQFSSSPSTQFLPRPPPGKPPTRPGVEARMRRYKVLGSSNSDSDLLSRLAQMLQNGSQKSRNSSQSKSPGSPHSPKTPPKSPVIPRRSPSASPRSSSLPRTNSSSSSRAGRPHHYDARSSSPHVGRSKSPPSLSGSSSSRRSCQQDHCYNKQNKNISKGPGSCHHSTGSKTSRGKSSTRESKEHSAVSSLSSLHLLRKDFVPFLLNFLREQTSQILSNGPSTPAKTPNAKPVSRSSYSGSQRTVPEKRSSNTSGHRGSRMQLFAETTNSPLASDTSFQSFTSASSDSSVLTRSNLMNCSTKSPNAHSCPSTFHGEKRSTHKSNLGNYLVLTPEGQPPRRARKKNNCPGRQVSKDKARRSIDGEMQENISGGASRTTQASMNSTSSPSNISQINLDNLDEFPPMGAASESASKSKPTRRINPTPVNEVQSLSKSRIYFTSTPISESNIRRSQVGTEVFTSVQEGSSTPGSKSLREEREILRLERCKLRQQTPTSVSLDPVTPTKQFSNRIAGVCVDGLNTADASKVSSGKQLQMLSELYSSLISENFVPNIFLEFFFVLQLLTSRGLSAKDEGDDDFDRTQNVKDAVEKRYFQSIHNCVFFAVQVLDSQFAIISHLDKATLKLLAENERVATFSPTLQERLHKAYEVSTAKVSLLFQTTIHSVSFQPETDNRSNFSSDRSFHIFKKQRDIFYELLRDWEDNHENPDWEFERQLGMRIRTMIFHLSNACNHSHFARLFQKQLIQMCKGPSTGMGGSSVGDTPDQDVLNMLGSDNLNRLKRLQERFVTPQSVGGPCPPPSFPGYQEFFRDFIVSAGSYQFNQHLMDSLCQEIEDLDGVSIVGHGPTEKESDVDDKDEKVHFASVLLTLRLLAKFLGFVTFLPYRTTESLTNELQESAVALRNRTLPILDVLALLRRSIQNRRTILTVPWAVEYLSLVDSVAPFLDYFRKLFSLLLQLYRCKLILTDNKDMGFLNKLLLLTVLGWFFQVPSIPGELFFNNVTLHHDISASAVVAATQELDCVPLVDQHLLYNCCPYLGELRKLLSSFVAGSGSKNGGFIRKITPTAAEPLLTKPTLSQKKLQAELEQAFFHNQPPSLRRTVEFVAERIGSNCVKHIKFCKDKVPEALRVLLPEEVSACILHTAEDIALTLATEKACTWLNSNISALIRREIKSAFTCMVKSQAVTTSAVTKEEKQNCVEGCEHKALKPSKLLMDLKDILCITVGPRDKAEGVEYRQLTNLFNQLSQTLRCRKYLYRPAESSLAKCSVELAALLVSDKVPVVDFFPAVVEATHSLHSARKEALCNLLMSLLSIWENDFKVPVPVELIFNQKSILSITKLQPLKWELFVFMLRGLVQRGLLGYEDVKRVMNSIEEYTWSPDFLLELGYVSESFTTAKTKDTMCLLEAQATARLTALS
uniref:Codanin-1 C-terminal domain-containing protein n=1 Tax=Leptobrachium leishanense TaxID=445787 RepID=A0A8C5MWA8_9ANUR